jgi:hypothetical protein
MGKLISPLRVNFLSFSLFTSCKEGKRRERAPKQASKNDFLFNSVCLLYFITLFVEILIPFCIFLFLNFPELVLSKHLVFCPRILGVHSLLALSFMSTLRDAIKAYNAYCCSGKSG